MSTTTATPAAPSRQVAPRDLQRQNLPAGRRLAAIAAVAAMWVAIAIAVIPLALVVFYVIKRGGG